MVKFISAAFPGRAKPIVIWNKQILFLRDQKKNEKYLERE